jgi:hypothetical protein
MTRFLIEREIDGAHDLTQDDRATIAPTSNDAVASLGVPYTWVTSYVAGDKRHAGGLRGLQLTATAPDRLDDRVLPALGVDLPTLRRLDATGLLTRARGGLIYRHELARQALESTIPPGGGPGLHARLLQALERVEPQEPAVLAHHAGDRRFSVRYTAAQRFRRS